MDPDANLEEQLRLSLGLLAGLEDRPCADMVDDAERLAELVVSLNDWIKMGGFLPKAWRK